METLYNLRLKKDLRLGHVNVDIIMDFIHGFRLIKRRQYYGLQDSEGHYVLRPVFDNVREPVSGSGLIVASIGDASLFFDIPNNKEISSFDKNSKFEVKEKEKCIVLQQGQSLGLWDIQKKRLSIPIEYDEVTTDLEASYLWVRKGNNYDFIRSVDQCPMHFTNIEEVYDSHEQMIVKLSTSDNIVILNEAGYKDSLALRKLVIQKGGHLLLKNSKHHKNVIIDVYGVVIR